MVEDFWMTTRAIGKSSAMLSVDCKKLDKRYAIVLGDPTLSRLPFGQQVRLDVRASNEQPFQVQGGATGDGNIVIDEIEHQRFFTLILMYMFVTEPAPKSIGFSLGPNQWFFSLEGIRPLADKLGQRCGFTPSPERARSRQRGQP
jgi:hypothetical protein